MTTRGTQDTAIELLLAEPERLEPGLVGLDSHLKLDDNVEIDVLLRDSLGYPVVVLFCEGEVSLALGQMAGVTEALQRGRYLLTRLFQNKGLDAALRPRFVLLGTRFPDSAPRVLDMMSQVEVHAMEYRVVKSSVGRPVLDLVTFHRGGGSSVAPGWAVPSRPRRATTSRSRPSAPAREIVTPREPAALPELPELEEVAPPRETERPAAVTPGPEPDVSVETPPVAEPTTAAKTEELQLLDDEPQSPPPAAAPAPAATGPDDLMQRARDSIRSLSPKVVEAKEGKRYLFKVGGKMLAALRVEDDGLQMQVGNGRGKNKPKTVKDDKEFNEQLNSIFTLYFDDLSPDRMSA